jgi:tetratricopeptide (TPR) repeat protein
MFITVVRDAPRFKAAWGKLLLAESELVGPSFVDGESNAQTANALREHIRDARRVDPNMAEALLAEAALVPPRDISGAVRLIERAAQQSPDNPAVVAHRAGVLARVGRSREAVELAQRAAELDPLSPTALNGFISTLAYAGRVETAQRELSQAERLWSGTAALRDAQYRFHFRYGDPNAALAMEESDTAGGTPRLYLNTKLQPTEENVAKLLKHVKGRLAHMRNPSAGLGFAIQTYGEFGDKEEVIRLLLNWPRRDDLGAIAELFFRPHLRQVRRDPRFMEIANRAGLLDYWRASGKWPDFCFDDDQPYDCKAEAAKTGA